MKFSKGAVAAVGGGAAQLAIVDPGVAMYLATQNQLPLKIVGGAQSDTGKDVAIVGGSSVTNAASLYQQKLGHQERADVAQLGTDVWLDSNGADSTSVTWAEMHNALLPAAISSGKVAAGIGPSSLLKGKSLADPVTDSFGDGAPLNVVIAGTDTDAATVKKFLGVLAKVPGFDTKLSAAGLESEAETLNDYAFTDGQPDLGTLLAPGAAK
jgi:ABC-type nitrate/sulfonate/bicarbonate transport system substrate-binding protein